MTEFEDGLGDPQSLAEQRQSTSNSGSSRMSVKASYNAYPSISGVQLHPVNQMKMESEQYLDGTTVRKESSEDEENDRIGNGDDRGSNSSSGGSELRKLDNFFAFLDQFANSHSSQRRHEMARRFSPESIGKESSTHGTEKKCMPNSREEVVVTTPDDDFLFTLLRSADGEEMHAITSSSENQSQSPGGEFWGGAVGGDGSGGDIDNEDISCFSIYQRCTAFGPGLNEGTVGRLNYFQVGWLPNAQTFKKIHCLGLWCVAVLCAFKV